MEKRAFVDSADFRSSTTSAPVASWPGTSAAVRTCALVERAPVCSAQMAARWLLPETFRADQQHHPVRPIGPAIDQRQGAALAGPSRKSSRERLSACGNANAS